MESANKKKWITMLLTATMSVVLLFGATACNDNGNNDGTNVVVEEDNSPDVDVIVPEDGSENPSPSASASE